MRPSYDVSLGGDAPDGAVMRTPSRHDRVWLDPATWCAALRSRLDDARVLEVHDWVRRGRALVTRRRESQFDSDLEGDLESDLESDLDAHALGLGLALPLALGRRRIGLVVDRRAVIRVAPPLALAEVVDAAPPDRRAALRDLCDRAVALATPMAVYGSFAWQALSGEDCVTATSDIDLLWDARDAAQVTRVVETLLIWEREHGLRADGEARLADGGAVAWRELTSGASRVIVKTDDGVALRPMPVVR